jgi:hypothetical protein
MAKIPKNVPAETAAQPSNGKVNVDPMQMSDEQLRASAAAIEKRRKEQYAKQAKRNAEKRAFAKSVLDAAKARGLVDEKGNIVTGETPGE